MRSALRSAARGATRGVTLIELLVVIVVLAILAAIAVPSYRSYVLRTQRTEATAALLRIGAAQEAFFLEHNRFASALATAPPDGLGVPAVSETSLYDLAVEITIPDGSGFRVSAVPRANAGQRDDPLCRSFTLDHNGLRGARDAAGADVTGACWR